MSRFDNLVKLNQFGFYELIDKPNIESLENYYRQKYYQTNKIYSHEYSAEERKYINGKLEQKYSILQKFCEREFTKFLDIGCGEGFALNFFKNLNFEILGVDYSLEGCKNHNPELVQSIIAGDILNSIDLLLSENKRFDVVLLDNVLEHVLEPEDLIKKCRALLNSDGLLIVEVPNDFSIIQLHLLETKRITEPNWIFIPDHISYFNNYGLKNLMNSLGFIEKISIADFPIDFFLFNDDSNYYKNKSKGKNCHNARIEIENLLLNIDFEKSLFLFKSLADLGLGRQIIGFYKINNEI